MTLLLVNHHYVHRRVGEGAIYPTSVKEMIERAKILEADGYVYIENYREYFQLTQSSEEVKFFHYTFDDGLREQYFAYEELCDAGYSPTFYISTAKYVLGKIDLVHLIHFMRHKHDDAKIIQFLGLSELDISVFKQDAVMQYRYDTPKRALIKYVLNFVLDEDEVRANLMAAMDEDDHKYFDELYMSYSQLHNLASDCRIGSHSHNHRALGVLSASQVKSELSNSKEFFTMRNMPVDSISFPYGGPSAIPDISLVREFFEFGITMQRDFNTRETNRLLLNRVDTNEVKSRLYRTYS